MTTVRGAHVRDAEGMGAVHHASWLETYGPLLPDDFWATRSVADRVELWTRLLSTPDPDHRIAVAVDGDQVVGIALSAAPRVGAHGAAPAVRDRELSTLYLLAAHHGTGVGRSLLESVLDPSEPAQLWVAEQNPRAVAFYRRNGFVPDGARSTNERFAGLAEIRLVR
ncbi:GNAT family N-acetyltransferase [Paraoerskovia marina]|uniref:Acetyltransferase (GNAT) domain-containing protein n=1 Tax=Paraoerskovia marina TaxID=545619 RepID=A0A1H1U624_9CELL|nr:GNAT family N-acetyltransferase [Paraoerskovia marina]SDS67706.1 Acetyltransferase (GNAT) domain-containing protein [Paraoerskovia marina]